MTERPIVLRPHEVRGIQSGSQTRLRRVVKPQPLLDGQGGASWDSGSSPRYWVSNESNLYRTLKSLCPNGQPGDRLWARETIDARCGYDAEYVADGRRLVDAHPLGLELCLGIWSGCRYLPPRTISSIHMPRWASRITLEIIEVRVERVQDISEADAKAECVECPGKPETASGAYRKLWESIYGPGSWDANPWVWVIESERVK